MSVRTDAARRLIRRIFYFLASLRLAVILLAVLIVAIAIGTIYESRFDAKVARAYIYEAPWFNAWLILLGVNLAAAAFSRYPWKKHHTGFVITHAGIITLLIGAVVGRVWGIEGTMTLFVGSQPSNRLVIDQPEVRIQEGDKTTAFPLGIRYRHAQPGQAILLGTTSGGWNVTLTDYAEHLLPVASPQAVTDGTGAPAVHVKLWTGMGPQVDEWLWPNDPDNHQVDLGLLAVDCQRGRAPMYVPIERHASLDETQPHLQKASTKSSPTPLSLPPGDRAVIYLSDNNDLTYYLQTKAGTVTQGALEPGKPMATGWDNWQMEVAEVLPQAVPSTDFKPLEKNAKLAPRDRANVTEGVKVEITRGDQHDEEWLASGWQMDLPASDSETLQASFGPKILPLPISLELKHFDVERQEGNDSPASFQSSLMVRDAAGNSAEGSCSMNEPMNFPDTFWRRWTGLTYKISQASWNPQNLQQSSVQILLDPGWLFKWSGSLMVCIGIFTMFYLRPPRDSAHP